MPKCTCLALLALKSVNSLQPPPWTSTSWESTANSFRRPSTWTLYLPGSSAGKSKLSSGPILAENLPWSFSATTTASVRSGRRCERFGADINRFRLGLSRVPYIRPVWGGFFIDWAYFSSSGTLSARSPYACHSPLFVRDNHVRYRPLEGKVTPQSVRWSFMLSSAGDFPL